MMRTTGKLETPLLALLANGGSRSRVTSWWPKLTRSFWHGSVGSMQPLFCDRWRQRRRTSFAVMERHRIGVALTSDRNFVQYGFQVLGL